MPTKQTELPAHLVCVTHSDHKLTCEEYDALRARAGDCCEICGWEYGLHIDHDRRIDGLHAVRGLLCAKCNALMRYVDEGTKDSPLAEKYEENAWYRGCTYFLSPQLEPADRRVRAMETAQCLGIDLRPTRQADLALPVDRQKWVDAFREVCDSRQPSRVDTLRFWHYLGWTIRDLPEPLVDSMDRVLARVQQRQEAIFALASMLECPYCGVTSGPCVAGRLRKPTTHLHEGRRLRAQRQYDEAPL